MPFPVFLITGRPQRGAQAPTLCDANAGRRGIVPPEAARGDHKPDSGGYRVEHLPGWARDTPAIMPCMFLT